MLTGAGKQAGRSGASCVDSCRQAGCGRLYGAGGQAGRSVAVCVVQADRQAGLWQTVWCRWAGRQICGRLWCRRTGRQVCGKLCGLVQERMYSAARCRYAGRSGTGAGREVVCGLR